MPEENDLEKEVTQQRMERPEQDGISGKKTMDNFMIAYNILCYILILFIFIYISILSFSEIRLFSFHPFCMTIGFFLTSTSILVHNRSNVLTKDMPFGKRFKLHWIMQAVGLICLTIGFLVIIINKNLRGKPHFTSLHGIFGLIAYICLIVTFLFAYCTWIIKWIFKSFSRRTQLETHISLAVITFCITVADYILGLYSGWFSRNSSYIGKWLCIISVIVISIHILLRPFRRTLLNKCCKRS